jgi:formamidopyrimidine-DNA glycosylase
MPELPDVEVIRRYLQSTALHKKITAVDLEAEIILPNVEDTQGKTSHKFKQKMIGRSFISTQRHGKWLFVALDGEDKPFLVFHFGMTGCLKYFKDMDDAPDYAQVVFHFDNDYQLAYVSTRKLGELELINSVDQFISKKGLGPDVLDPDFDLAAFKAAVKGRRTMVKSILMDQETMAGIGNVYSDEILYQAGIYPRTKINHLSEGQLETLFHTMKDVLQTAIEYQAEPEKFPDNFLTPHRHKGGKCPQSGDEIKRVKVGSRHAYFCPNRQKKQ